MGRAKVASATSLVSESSLKLLKSANSFVAIPSVSVAAEAALSILAITQSVQANRNAFIGLAEKACFIMAEVIRKVNEAEQPNSSVHMSQLKQECAELCVAMTDIEKIIYKHVHSQKRSALMQRFLRVRTDEEVIKESKDRLQTALDLFTTRGYIELRQTIDAANKRVDDLAKAGKVGGKSGPTVNQYVGQNAYSYSQDGNVRVDGIGSNVIISHASVS